MTFSIPLEQIGENPAPAQTRVERWRAGHPDRVERLPDAVTDTNIRREAAARRMEYQAAAVQMQARNMGATGDLVHAVVPVCGELYDPAAACQAWEIARLLLSGWPALGKLEYAAQTGLHLHLVMPVECVPDVKKWGYWAKPLDDDPRSLPRLLRYLAKPQDARACASNHEREPNPAGALAAAEAYLQARYEWWEREGRRRLPVARRVLNVPRRVLREAKHAVYEGPRLTAVRAARAAALLAKQSRRMPVAPPHMAVRPNTRRAPLLGRSVALAVRTRIMCPRAPPRIKPRRAVKGSSAAGLR